MTTYQYQTPDHVTQNVNGVGPWTARKQWCEQHCEQRWYYQGGGKFEFVSQRDYFWFLLRWGQ